MSNAFTVEGFFSLLKRGINGTFHHVRRGHLNRYCDEFAFRYENRREANGHRAAMIVSGAEGSSPTSNQQQIAKAEREKWKRAWGPVQQRLGF